MQVSGSFSGRQTPQRNYFYGTGGKVGYFFPPALWFSASERDVRLTFHRGDSHALCMHIAFGWEKEVFYKNMSLEITVTKGKDHFIS